MSGIPDMSTISDMWPLTVWLPAGPSEIYRLVVAEARADGEVDVDGYVAMIATRLNEQATEISAVLCTTLLDNVSELPRDDQTIELMHRAVRDHLQTILHAVLHDIDVKKIAVPPTPIEYVRR